MRAILALTTWLVDRWLTLAILGLAMVYAAAGADWFVQCFWQSQDPNDQELTVGFWEIDWSTLDSSNSWLMPDPDR